MIASQSPLIARRTRQLNEQRKSRGAASLEAVIVIPIFVILLVSIAYVRDRYVATQAAETKARSCAWQYSARNCDEIPPECSAELLSSDTAVGSDVGTQIDERMAEVMKAATNQHPKVDNASRSVTSKVQDDVFGRHVESKASVLIPRPALYGGGQAELRGAYYLACNLKRKKPLDVVTDAWNAFK